MKPTTSDDIFALIDSYVISAALGTAMQTGLFWLLEKQPLNAHEIASQLDIPLSRCQYWLQLMCSYNLLEQSNKGYIPSSVARTAILETYSQDTWAFLAREAHERFPAVLDLTRHIHTRGSVWDIQELTPPDYFAHLQTSPERARQFTRMLYEIHQPLAALLAQSLDVTNATRLLDLGGGSGVMAMALLRSNPQLTAVVFDIPNVCAAGRELANENALAERISYQPGDFTQDTLPSGFDIVLECDVGSYSQELLNNIRSALNPKGRLVIVDKFAPSQNSAHPTRLHWAFLGSLEDPYRTGTTADQVERLLNLSGFNLLSTDILPSGDSPRWESGWRLIEAGL
jgi:SAM-dependent methyltransferase